MPEKFSKGKDLDVFLSKVFTHLEAFGLDTITYLPDPGSPTTTMSSVVQKHARFSVESVASSIGAQVQKYDSYDLQNDADAVTFLMNSVSDEIYRELNLVSEKGDHFPIVFMKFMKIARTVTIERLEALKNQIKKRKPTDYPGQDLSKLATDYLVDAIELESAGHYDHSLTLKMLESFMSAGGRDSDSVHASLFSLPLHTLHQKLSKVLIKVPFLDKAAADAIMLSEELTFRQICTAATDSYRAMYTNGNWGPARSNPDTKKAPANFGLTGIPVEEESGTPVTAAQVNALIQHAIKSAAKDQHQSKKSDSRKGFGKGKKDQKGNGFKSKKATGNQPSWRTSPPKPGEAQTQTRGNREMHWCRHCERWTPTHGSDGHSNEKTRKPEANHLTMSDFAMWHVDFEVAPSWNTILSSMWTILQRVMMWIGGGVLLAPVFLLMSYAPVVAVWIWHQGLAGAIMHWLSLLVLVLTIRLRPAWISSRLIDDKPPASPPPLSRRERRYRNKMIGRNMKRLLRPYQREHTPEVLPHSTPARHHNQRNVAYRRPPIAQRHRDRMFDVLQRLVLIENKLDFFCRQHTANAAGRSTFPEGENRRSGPSSHKHDWKRKMKRSRSPKLQNAHRHPHGLTTTETRPLNSPFTKIYMATMELPSYLLSASQALKAALVAPEKAMENLKQNEKYKVIWDSGASISISPFQSDFVGPIEKAPIGLRLQGIAKGLKVTHVGHVAWAFKDSTGMLRTLKVKALLVPGASARLLSTSSLLDTYKGETITQDSHRLRLSGTRTTKEEPPRNEIEVLVDPTTNIPTAIGYSPNAATTIATTMNATISATLSSNHNLSPAEKELLRWHFRLGHLSFKKIQFLMRTGVLAHSEGARRLQTNASKLTSCPLCAACQFGKQKRRPSPGKQSTAVRDRTHVMKDGDLFPGQRISVDHFICSTRGRLSNTYGKEEEKRQYSGGAIFVDHASGYLHVEPQVNLNSHETLDAVKNFEKHCRDLGVLPQSYQSDNASVFTSDAYTKHLETFAQVNSLAGVGAHHHNSVAERSIHTVVSIARTMMLHSATHWPDVANAKLWNLAVQHAVLLYNHMPDPANGVSPHDLFTRTRWPHAKFHDFHVWGCPVYVLEKTLADGKKIPKWKARSDRQMFVGFSPKHASSVPLVLNLETGAITSQFHVVFDDWFATISADGSKLPDIGSDEWQSLFGDSIYQYPMDEDDITDLTQDEDVNCHLDRSEEVARAFDSAAPAQALNVDPPPERAPVMPQEPPSTAVPPPDVTPAPTPVLPPRSSPTPSPSVEQPQSQDSTPSLQREPPSAVSTSAMENTKSDESGWTKVTRPSSRTKKSTQPVEPAPLRRSTRIRQAPQRLIAESNHFAAYTANAHCPHSVAMAARAKKAKDPDTLSFDEAMRDVEREKWMEAARIEIEALEKMHCWDEVPISDAGNAKIIPGTFIFRRKRSPDGQVRKYKGRFCVRGDLQEDEEDTFAPVVSWPTTRLVLILAILWGWVTCSIDFTNAFVHAMLKKPIWIHLPRGFGSSKQHKTCLRLRRSLYGTQIAPKLWYEACSGALLRLGFKQSKFDQCLFYKKDMMVVMYVDDCVICAKTENLVDKLVEDLRAAGFTLTREGTFAEYLGIKFTKREDGSLVLTQQGLIDKVIAATGLEDANPNWMPTTQVALGTDPEGAPYKESWKYASVVGMLLYLSSNTRPDIAFAVSQVCRFSSNPKQSHAAAVKTIVRYLKRTRDKGTILKPSTGKLDLSLYVDADFCGLHRREDDRDANAARSRAGFIIMLNDCPIYWKSQLINHICLSTLEAEYSALSNSLRVLLPIQRLLQEIVDRFGSAHEVQSQLQASVFEDNQGALLLAQNHRVTSRTKYFLVKWHWFWAHADEVTFVKVESENQRADFLTKGLSREAFEHNRRLTLGW